MRILAVKALKVAHVLRSLGNNLLGVIPPLHMLLRHATTSCALSIALYRLEVSWPGSNITSSKGWSFSTRTKGYLT